MKIRTYKKLKEYIGMFKNKNADLLIIKSRAGLGKTTLLKGIMGKEFVYVSTHSTPLKTYINLYENRDKPVCFDDMSSLLTSGIMISMLKCLAETTKEKELFYETTSTLIGDTPSSFKTTSNACLLLNQFDEKNPILVPIIDRGFFIEFNPSKKEILKQIKKFASSGKSEICVYEFVKKYHQIIKGFSLRTYVKALQLHKEYGNKWKEEFKRLVSFDEQIIEYLELKKKYKKERERKEHFSWKKTTYYKVKKEVEG